MPRFSQSVQAVLKQTMLPRFKSNFGIEPKAMPKAMPKAKLKAMPRKAMPKKASRKKC